MVLCQHCDCHTGLGGAGVFRAPEGMDRDWLASHCWGCGRTEAEVRADPRGRPAAPFLPGRVMP